MSEPRGAGDANPAEKPAPAEEFFLQAIPSEASATFDLTDIDDRANVVLHAKLAGLCRSFPAG